MATITPDETILGLLAVRERHGYDLLDCFRDPSQLGEVWNLSTSQLYAVLKRLESWPTPVSPYHMAYVHTGLGDFARALDYLEQAFDKGTGATIGLKGSFLCAPLRGHPRFTALLQRLKLA